MVSTTKRKRRRTLMYFHSGVRGNACAPQTERGSRRSHSGADTLGEGRQHFVPHPFQYFDPPEARCRCAHFLALEC